MENNNLPPSELTIETEASGDTSDFGKSYDTVCLEVCRVGMVDNSLFSSEFDIQMQDTVRSPSELTMIETQDLRIFVFLNALQLLKTRNKVSVESSNYLKKKFRIWYIVIY